MNFTIKKLVQVRPSVEHGIKSKVKTVTDFHSDGSVTIMRMRSNWIGVTEHDVITVSAKQLELMKGVQ